MSDKIKQVVVSMVLVGTEYMLDLPEKDCAVIFIEDAAEMAKKGILEVGKKHPNLGWSLIMGTQQKIV